MASQSSSNSSTSQNQDVNKQNQLPNSTSKVGSSSGPPNNNNNEGKDESNNSDSMLYSCNYCKGKYSSLQALGGHQNAHKAERALKRQQLKQRYEGCTSNLGQPRFNPYLNYPRPSTPFTPYNYRPLIGVNSPRIGHGAFTPYNGPRIGQGAFTPYNFRPLGERMESLIPKSPCISPRIGVSLRNNVEGSNSGVASLGIGGATTSRTGDEVGTNNPNGAIRLFGESLTNNVAPNSKSNVEEEPSATDSSGLDLSLKL